jgi:hypothetical protein
MVTTTYGTWSLTLLAGKDSEMAEDESLQLPLFGSWLKQTRILQTVSFGQDPAELEGEARADFISWNFTAMVIELGEMMGEFPSWKPWVTERGENLNREQFIAEMVDALHFAGNILAAVECTDEEFNEAYLKKMAKNAARMASGEYDGVSDKCPICKREYEVPGYCLVHGRVV